MEICVCGQRIMTATTTTKNDSWRKIGKKMTKKRTLERLTFRKAEQWHKKCRGRARGSQDQCRQTENVVKGVWGLKGSWGGQALSWAAQLDHLLIVVSNAIVVQISDCLSIFDKWCAIGSLSWVQVGLYHYLAWDSNDTCLPLIMENSKQLHLQKWLLFQSIQSCLAGLWIKHILTTLYTGGQNPIYEPPICNLWVQEWWVKHGTLWSI